MAKVKIKNQKIKESLGDRILNTFIGAILVFVIVIIAYPLIYVVSSSVSSSAALESGKVILWPVDFSLEAYEFVMNYKSVWNGFKMSLFYCLVDVVFQTSITIMGGYAMSRKYFHARNFYTLFMFLGGRVPVGMIPGFILKCDLGLFNNIWAILISGTISISHFLILRTAINTVIPGELHDAARIDGANHFQVIIQLVVPLTKATLSVLILYTLVGQWNDYFTAMIYLRDAALYPLQLVLRPIMTAASAAAQMKEVGNMQSQYQQMAEKGLENVRYALILISSAPAILLYFAVQKNFKGGMMMGSLKG